jgi:LysM repeat protein
MQAVVGGFNHPFLLQPQDRAGCLIAWFVTPCLLTALVCRLLLQVLLSTAQWLATNQGFDKHGTCLTSKDLQEPKTCVYFAAAYLTLLSNSGGVPRSEGFVVRAYNAGPKGVDTAAALTCLQKYLKAKHCLTQVANAMAVTLAAAAFEVDMQLPDAAVPADAAPSTDALAGLCSKAGLSNSDDGTGKPSKDQGSSCTDRADDLGGQTCRTASSSNPPASSSPSSRVVMVRQAAASCVAALSSDWLAPQQAVSSPQAAPAGSTGAGGLLAYMLQSRWGFSGSQHQQQGQYVWPGSSTHGCGSALALEPVAAADLCAAWQRMVCISPSVAHAALEQAAAAAALAPLPTRQLPEASSSSFKAAAASAASAPAGPADMWLGRTAADSSSAAVKGSSSRGSSRETTSPAAAASTPQLDSMPCVIHVVGAGETLEHIASICSMELSELLAANPDVVDAEAVHHNDCIAVPVPVVFPRLYVIQHGDTLHSIARAHEVPLGRLLAKNPELTDPTSVQPGWVVALPGLKGDSQVSLPADWLLQAPVAGTTTPPQQALWSGAVTVSAAGQNADVQVASWQRVQEEVPVATAGRAAQNGVSFQRSRSQPRQRSRSRAHQQQGQQDAVDMHLPSLGSGAFMFTVGSPGIASSSSLTSNASSTRAAAGMPQRQLSAGRQGGGPVDRLKGSSGSSGVVPGNSLELARSWTVGTDASDVH